MYRSSIETSCLHQWDIKLIMGFCTFVLAASGAFAGDAASAGPLPSNRPNEVQQLMIARKYGMFIHFGINTFNNQEWTDGSISVNTYTPTALDTDQWVRTARDAGMKYVILTAKHHDGFCLWDSAFTDYDVGSSSVKTDVVAALAKSCKKYKIQLGLYYSLWDRHEPSYKDDAKYVAYMTNQLTELMRNYGPICELWLDGGWEKLPEAWDMPMLYGAVKKHQPKCAVGVNWTIADPAKPEVRMGSKIWDMTPDKQKEGFPVLYFPSDFRLCDPHIPVTPDPKLFTHEGRTYYLPFEATVCLNEKWFFNTEDKRVKSVDELEKLYRQATSQDNILILNSPPNRDGVMSEANVKVLNALAARLGLSVGKK